MSTTPPNPNDKNQPKKPAGPTPGANNPGANKPTGPTPNANKPGGTPSQPQKPGATPAKPGATPARPVAAGGKPAPQPARKPAPKQKHTHIDANTRQLGTKFVDLGFMDDAQLEAIY